MVIKKVTVKFDSCTECPVNRYTGCSVSNMDMCGDIPVTCPIESSVLMNRYTNFQKSDEQ